LFDYILFDKFHINGEEEKALFEKPLYGTNVLTTKNVPRRQLNNIKYHFTLEMIRNTKLLEQN